ncbi:MAG: SMP-30/gluconolactonase/LRE family protein [Pseudomonadales bacterium]|nr:SMP-30/gluconolactonase/LRE family protein [Pseudomonadales bacterium]MCP5185445.1 SMP-30/gluconolactonase/LRE family protein [Pseudomonadales bacterium]
MMRYLLVGLAVFLAACGKAGAPATGDAATAAKSQRVLAAGAQVAGVNGLHFAPDGALYAASVIGSEMVVVDPDSGEIRRRYGAADGVHGPDDVAFGPDGSWFWTSIMTGEVAGFTAAGERVVAAQLTPGVNPITFSDDGRLFVSQCFFGTNLYEVDPTGEKPARLIADDLGPGCGLNGMDWGPDGRLYGPRWFTGEIVRFNVDTGERETVADGFRTPAAVKFDSQGRLHVLDTGLGTVNRLEGTEKVVVATLDPGLDNFAFDRNDRLFVSSFVDGYIARVEPDGRITKLLPGGIAHPGGVTVVPMGGRPAVLVADLHSLRGFDPDTGESLFVERNVLGVGELGSVLSVAADGTNVILASFTDNSVRRWDPVQRRNLQRWDNLAAPVGAIPYAGGVAVALYGTQNVVLLGDGEPLTLAAGLASPTGLAVDGDTLLVSDRATGRVLRIARGGAPIAAEEVASGLANPEGIRMSAHGLVVVEGESGRVLLVRDGVAREVAKVAPGTPPSGPASPPSMIFNDVEVAGDTLFVTSETDHALVRVDNFAADL